jgi:hypothetical protein
VAGVRPSQAKAFHSMLGWCPDADVSGDEYRLVKFTPPGSACSILSNQVAGLEGPHRLMMWNMVDDGGWRTDALEVRSVVPMLLRPLELRRAA